MRCEKLANLTTLKWLALSELMKCTRIKLDETPAFSRRRNLASIHFPSQRKPKLTKMATPLTLALVPEIPVLAPPEAVAKTSKSVTLRLRVDHLANPDKRFSFQVVRRLFWHFTLRRQAVGLMDGGDDGRWAELQRARVRLLLVDRDGAVPGAVVPGQGAAAQHGAQNVENGWVEKEAHGGFLLFLVVKMAELRFSSARGGPGGQALRRLVPAHAVHPHVHGGLGGFGRF